MTNRINKIFSHSECISTEMKQKYISGELNTTEKHMVELHLIDCEMCSDELEGMKLIQAQELNAKVSEINSIIDAQIFKKNKKIWFADYRIQAIAASILIMLFFSIFYINDYFNNKSDKIFSEYFEPFHENKSNLGDSLTNQKQMLSEALPAENAIEKREGNLTENIDEILIENERAISEKENREVENATKTPYVVTGKSIDANDLVVTNMEESPQTMNEDIAKAEKTTVFLNLDATNSPATSVTKEDSDDSQIAYGGAVSQTKNTESLLADIPYENNLVNVDNFDKKKEDCNKESAQLVEITSTKNARSNNKESLKDVSNESRSEVPTSIVTSSFSTGEFELGMEQYNANDFLSAIKSFKHSINNGVNKYKAIFYIGVSYLNIGEVENAIQYFQTIEKDRNNEFYFDTQWYLALCYTKNNELSKAQYLLKKLIESESTYKEKAEKLLKEIK